MGWPTQPWGTSVRTPRPLLPSWTLALGDVRTDQSPPGPEDGNAALPGQELVPSRVPRVPGRGSREVRGFWAGATQPPKNKSRWPWGSQLRLPPPVREQVRNNFQSVTSQSYAPLEVPDGTQPLPWNMYQATSGYGREKPSTGLLTKEVSARPRPGGEAGRLGSGMGEPFQEQGQH